MVQSDFHIRNIANVVHSWMGYLYEVSEVKHLAAESSLKYPIVGLLERKVAITNIELEIEHPSFSLKRVDFYWEGNSTKNYMEMKYIRDSKVDIQKILNDVFRLALIDDKDAQKYFLACGRAMNFQKYFQNVSQNESNQKIIEIIDEVIVKQSGESNNNALDTYFCFVEELDKRIIIDVENDKHYKKFKEEYEDSCKDGYMIPDMITISIKLLQPINKGLESAVAVWKIERIEDELL